MEKLGNSKNTRTPYSEGFTADLDVWLRICVARLVLHLLGALTIGHASLESAFSENLPADLLCAFMSFGCHVSFPAARRHGAPRLYRRLLRSTDALRLQGVPANTRAR